MAAFDGERAYYRLGADENGLGARLGPLVVTAVRARVAPEAQRLFRRKLRGKIAKDLDDSKNIVSHGNTALGEAWARVLTGETSETPQSLFQSLSLEGMDHLTSPCPRSVLAQCWSARHDAFVASDDLLSRVRSHVSWLQRAGLTELHVKTSVVCTRRLNEDRERGGNRFTSDLHAMERLILSLGGECGQEMLAVCGKVGGMTDYSRFFGPLSMRLHNVLEVGRARSAYRFPTIGEIHFVRDADATDPLVMLSSLVGKYVRELLMHRVWQHYRPDDADKSVSGYHDPTTAKFVEKTSAERKRRRVPLLCFERARDSAP